MLNQRLIAQFKAVSIDDESTVDIPDKLMVIYGQTRDFDLIADEVAKLEKKPTIFHVMPLQADKEYLVDSMLTNGSEAAKSIFRHHVKSADNYPKADGTPLIVPGDDGILSSDVVDSVPRNVVHEIAGVIIHKANESTKPFSMPDTWLRTRIKFRALRVQRAEIKSAKQNDTE